MELHPLWSCATSEHGHFRPFKLSQSDHRKDQHDRDLGFVLPSSDEETEFNPNDNTADMFM